MVRLYAALLVIGALLLTSCYHAVRDWREPSVSVPASGDDGAVISFSDLEAAGSELYVAVAEGREVSMHLTEIFSIFDMPVLGNANAVEIDARRTNNEPFVLDVQLQAMVKGYENGSLVTLKSFCAAFAEAGVRIADGPLTEAYLTNSLAPLVGKPTIEPKELLPALVLAIGHARAVQVDGMISNPVWGDDYLDPLQFILLSYAFQSLLVMQTSSSSARQWIPADVTPIARESSE